MYPVPRRFIITFVVRSCGALWQVSGVIWADSGRLCALTLGTPVTLVVALGAREAEVCAVVHASVVLHALQAQPLGARAVHQELARLLDEHHGAPLDLPDDVLEDIKGPH